MLWNFNAVCLYALGLYSWCKLSEGGRVAANGFNKRGAGVSDRRSAASVDIYYCPDPTSVQGLCSQD